MWKTYFCTATIEETLQLLSKYAGKAKVIAGGTDLVLELERGIYPQNEFLIDISRIGGLDEIIQDNDGTIHIGPMVTHNHCVKSRLLHQSAPLLVQACYTVGSPQIRNRGTVAGNLVTASPANDTISPLMALNASVTLQSISGKRVVKLSEFYRGVRKTVIQPDEMLVDISFKALKQDQKSTFKKYALRKAQAISLVNSSIILKLVDKKVVEASITLGAVAPTILHAINAEAALVGKELTDDVLEVVSHLVMEDIAPISDIRSSADYRKKIASIIVKRGLEEIARANHSETIPDQPVVLWGDSSPNNNKLMSKQRVISESGSIHTKINGKDFEFKTGQNKTLLHLLREEAGLIGSKEGCAEGECGACTIFLDGVAVMSCLVPAPRADGSEIVTIEGVSNETQLHPVQQAFIEHGAVQCGYCTPGFVMSAVKLFEEKKNPDIDEIKMALTGNLCRCTGYYKIIKAIESVAEKSE